MKSFEERVREVERTVGATLPPNYTSFLRAGPPTYDGAVGVPVRGELWNVTDFLELSNGEDYRQLDYMVQLLFDALPQFALPIALDHAGNFFCLFLGGEKKGEVAWWHHEREAGDDHTENVAPSFEVFVASIKEINE
jgi:hypothetical protein